MEPPLIFRDDSIIRELMNIKKRLLVYILSLSIITASVPLSAVYSRASYNEALQFNLDGKFTVMQLADIQENKDVEPGTIDLITKSIARYSPDLVVLTGDNIKGLISANSFRSAVDQFLAPILAANTRFAVTFGNHDDLGAWPVNPGSREEQYAYYKQKGGSLFVDHDVPALDGTGSGSIPIYPSGQSSGIPAFQVFLMDSGGYINITLDLDAVKTSQIDYYMATNPSVPCLWFQHIPVPEFYNLLIQVPQGTPHSFKGSHRPFKDYYWAMNTALIDWKASGSTEISEIFKEAPGPTDLETYQGPQYRSSPIYGSKTLYEAWLANGNMKGAFFGHNHTNSFVGTTEDGISLGYAKAATLEAYNDGDPGVRVFEINQDGSYTTISATRSSLDNYSVGDYSAVNNAIAAARVRNIGGDYYRVNSINDLDYYNPSSTTIGDGVYPASFFTCEAQELRHAIRSVESNLDSRSQWLIDSFAVSIIDAWHSLSLKEADYSLVIDLLAREDQNEILAPPHYTLTHAGQMLPAAYYADNTLEDWYTAKNSITSNFKIPDQATVNEMANSLLGAYESLKLKPEYERGNLAASPGFTTVVNHESLYIYGLIPGIAQSEFESGFVRLYGNGHLAYDYQPHGFGTGTKVRFVDNLTNTVIYTYTLLIFGDVNGDGNVDSGDAGTAVDYENYLISWGMPKDAVFHLAGDVNGDGNVDSIDAGVLVDFENYLANVSQDPGSFS